MFVLFGIAVVVAGCASGDGDSDREARLPVGAGSVRDLSAGGTCEARETITVTSDGASPVIEGDCGAVTVTGAGVSGNIDSATAVTIRAEGVTLLGADWGTATVSGSGTGLNVDHIDTLHIDAPNARVTNKTLGTVVVNSDSATINSSGIENLTVKGSRSTVVVSGAIGRLQVTGSRNSVNWDQGAAAPTADTGSGNTYNR